MGAAETALVKAAIQFGLAFVVGYGLYKIISGKGAASSASDFGRKWLAWAVFGLTLIYLPKIFTLPDFDSFARWISVIAFYGSVAFVAGWIYGKFSGNKQETIQDSVQEQPNVESEPSESAGSSQAALNDRWERKPFMSQEEYEAKRKDIIDSI